VRQDLEMTIIHLLNRLHVLFRKWSISRLNLFKKKVTYITCILSKLTEMVMNEEQRETLTSKVSVEIAAMSNNLSNTQTQNISI